jgi:hypothetical protein
MLSDCGGVFWLIKTQGANFLALLRPTRNIFGGESYLKKA